MKLLYRKTTTTENLKEHIRIQEMAKFKVVSKKGGIGRFKISAL
jgi:hypothetical protein